MTRTEAGAGVLFLYVFLAGCRGMPAERRPLEWEVSGHALAGMALIGIKANLQIWKMRPRR